MPSPLGNLRNCLTRACGDRTESPAPAPELRALCCAGGARTERLTDRPFRFAMEYPMRPDYSFVIPILNEREHARGAPSATVWRHGATRWTCRGRPRRRWVNRWIVRRHAMSPRARSRARGSCGLSRNFGHQSRAHRGARPRTRERSDHHGRRSPGPSRGGVQLAEQWRRVRRRVRGPEERTGASLWVKLATASWFYRLMNQISEVRSRRDAGDFRLIDRRASMTCTRIPSTAGTFGACSAGSATSRPACTIRAAASHRGRDQVPDAQDDRVRRRRVVLFSMARLWLADESRVRRVGHVLS